MTILLILALLFIVFTIVTVIQYRTDVKKSYDRLTAYNVGTVSTDWGTMSYVEEGTGEAILISHGIFGGYDQGMTSLRELVGNDFRKIAVSRFGYPGSELPENPTPENQAGVFAALLDELGIEQTYILTTSAGGAAGFRFSLAYPERVKGLILLSSGVPDRQRNAEEVKEMGMMGPPRFLVNDFPMWFAMKYFGFVFNGMMGSQIDGEALYETMLPVASRRQGIIADTDITNVDMTLHYDEYPVEEIEVPILIIHAKDDPMAKYEDVEIFMSRIDAEAFIFETGGHLLTGNGDDVNRVINNFITTVTNSSY